MSEKLFNTIQTELSELVIENQRLLLAVSGGIDSMVLMDAIQKLSRNHSAQILVAHYDHQWRSDSEQDAIFVLEEAANRGLSCFLGRAEAVPGIDEKKEEHARHQRYAFFDQLAKEQNCEVVLTAHNADDQVETILHHLFRGTGLTGLSGMSRVRQLSERTRLVRPILTISRAEIQEYAEENQVAFREDATNQSVKFTRNQIRHEVLTWLEMRGFSTIRESILRLSHQSGEIQASLEWLIEQVLSRALLAQTRDRMELCSESLRDVPRHLQREVFVTIWKRNNWPRQEMGFKEWDRLADLVVSAERFHLPGRIDCRQKRGKIILQRERNG